MEFLDSLQWRYAVKTFDSNQKLSDDDLDYLKESIRLTPSSYGLQLYKVLIIESQALKDKLKSASWGQSQISDASHIFLFCNYFPIKTKHIDEYIRLKSDTQLKDIKSLQPYGDFIKKTLNLQSDEQKSQWAIRQTYIALGQLLVSCAIKQIDACPMEGFEAEEYDKLLGLTNKGLYPAVLAAVGYRSEQDNTQHDIKIRKPLDQLFETL